MREEKKGEREENGDAWCGEKEEGVWRQGRA